MTSNQQNNHYRMVSGERRLQIGLYLTAVFLYWMSLYLYVPTLPVFAQTKTTNLALVGVVLSMYGLWQALVRLPLGIAADWLGWRKPFLVVGFMLAGLGAWIMGSSEHINGLIIGRSITGLAAGTWVPLVAVFSGLFPAGEAVRATAILSLVNSISRMLATAVTGSLNQWGGYALAFRLAAVVALLSILAVLPAREKRRPLKAPNLAQIGGLVSRRDVFLPAALNAVAQYANWTATFSFFPILARQLGASDVVLSLLLSINIGVVMAGNLTTTMLVKRIGSRRLIYFSFGLQAVGLCLAAVAPALWLLFVAQFSMGLAAGMGYPVLMGKSIEFVDEGERTTAMGLHQAVYAIGMFAGPWLSGILADVTGLRPMFGVTALISLLLGFGGTRLLEPGPKLK